MADEKLVDAALAQIRASLEHEIEEEHLERVRKGVDDKLDQAQRLREHDLANGDEPLTVFQAYRERS